MTLRFWRYFDADPYPAAVVAQVDCQLNKIEAQLAALRDRITKEADDDGEES